MSDAIAIYGAVIGTAAAIGVAWNIYDSIFRDRAKLAVSSKFGDIHWHGESLACVTVKVSNVGRRPVTIANCYFRRTDRGNTGMLPGAATLYGALGLIVDESHKFPKRLEEGESHVVWFPIASFDQQNGSLGTLAFAVADDGAGREWKVRLHSAIVEALSRPVKEERNEDPEEVKQS